MSCWAETASRTKSRLRGVLLHLGLVLRDHDLVGAEAQAVLDLARRGGEEHDVGAERLRELHAHVPEPAQTHDSDLLAGTHLPVAKGRIGRDAGAEQGRGRGRVEPRGDAKNEGLVDHDARRVAAQGHAPEGLVRAVVGQDRKRKAVLLVARLAVRAGAAGVDHAADSGDVPHLELRDPVANPRDPADDLVPGHARIHGVVPFVAGLVQVGVAHPAEEDLDLDILGSGLAAHDLEGSEGRAGGLRGVGLGFGSRHGEIVAADAGRRHSQNAPNYSQNAPTVRSPRPS